MAPNRIDAGAKKYAVPNIGDRYLEPPRLVYNGFVKKILASNSDWDGTIQPEFQRRVNVVIVGSFIFS